MRGVSGQCEVCGNEYDKCFEVVTHDGERHTFDCFECAIQAMAPTCGNCGVRVIGHGLEAQNTCYCCAHCAEAVGVKKLVDRV